VKAPLRGFLLNHVRQDALWYQSLKIHTSTKISFRVAVLWFPKQSHLLLAFPLVQSCTLHAKSWNVRVHHWYKGMYHFEFNKLNTARSYMTFLFSLTGIKSTVNYKNITVAFRYVLMLYLLSFIWHH